MAGKTGLGGAVDDHGILEGRQSRARADRLHAAVTDGEGDRIEPAVGVGVQDRLPQRAGTGIVGGRDREDRQQTPILERFQHEYLPTPGPWLCAAEVAY